MKKIFLFILFQILFTNCFSQWIWQNPLPQGNDLLNLQLINQQKIIASGNTGALIQSFNNGNTWYPIQSDTNNFNISLLSIIDSLNWWGIGNNSSNAIFMTTNGGLNWIHPQNSPNGLYSSVCFLNKNTGYAICSYTVFKTTDSGNNWNINNTNSANSLFFLNIYTGYTVGTNGLIFKTTNGGINWISQNCGCTSNLFSVVFKDISTGWALGSNLILITTNGGTIWDSLKPNLNYPIPYPPYYFSLTLENCSFINAQTGWVIGNNEGYEAYRIISTTNGGINWNYQSIGNYFKSIKFLDSQTGIIAGKNGLIFRTTDGGLNWTKKIQGVINDWSSIFFINPLTGWCVGGRGTILKTTNGGSLWDSTISLQTNTLNSIYFVNSQTGWTVGGSAGANGYVIYKTTNGGTSWILQLSSTSPNNGLYSVFFLNVQTGFTVGGSGLIFKTTNGGTNWNSYSGTNTNYNNIQFISPQTGWIFGGGIVTKTTNGGDNWAPLGTISNCTYGCFADTLTGWVGNLHYISKTTNGGNNWNTQLSLPSGNDWFTTLKFINKRIGFATCNSGIIFKTTNGGLNWSMNKIAQNWLSSIFFVDTLTGWIAGCNGIIVKTTNCGSSTNLENYNSIIPGNSSLNQNYPNPFNPSTKIRFQIKQTGFVLLKVYDILGKEIKILVKEKLGAGTYEVQFSINDLPSGVYFYRIETKDFVQTKKMIFIK